LTDATLAEYVVSLEAEGKKPATAMKAIASVKAIFKAGGREFPGGVLTSQTLKGYKRQAAEDGRGVKQASGLDWSAADTVATLASNGGGTLSGLRDSALISVMSDAMLRISEA